jgi:hypothetical protein
MAAVSVEDWGNFASAELGAAAALAGLLFVGLSMNLKEILDSPWLPGRSMVALTVLVGVLIVSSYMLIPGQGLAALGIEVAATGLLLCVFCTYSAIGSQRSKGKQFLLGFSLNLALLEASLVPYVIGGLMLVAGMAQGFYWIAAAMIVSFVKAVVDSWVLLVEINR